MRMEKTAVNEDVFLPFPRKHGDFPASHVRLLEGIYIHMYIYISI